MNLYEETKFIMKKYGITANKSLGQNFLIDDETVNSIIDSANINKEDLAIEIGPGLGTLTKPLLESAGKVICIELDKRMIEILNDRFKFYNNFKIINDDVLKVDLKKLIKENKVNGIQSVKIVANLPYYITTPIIMKLLEDKLDIKTITVMVQKEVADRLTALPGEKYTGAITYSINYYTNPKKVWKVDKSFFLPAPEVDSTVIQLEVLSKPNINVKDEKTMFKIIKAAFMQKRKTLLNSLANSSLFGTKEKLEKLLESLDINPQIRAENLTLEDFAKISNEIVKS